MPTINYGTARTVRDEFEKAALGDIVGEISYTKPKSSLCFRGSTTATAQTELFINGKAAITGFTDSAKRMYIGENSGHAFNITFMAFDTVLKTVIAAGTGFVACSRPNAGNVILSAVATGTDGAGNTKTTNPNFLYNVGNTAAFAIAFDADTTNQSLRCRVTAPTTNLIQWKVEIVPFFNITDRASSSFFGDRGAGDSVEI
jgi:hypothetical protein